jgi:two-component system chemotaxis response regulator CheY
VTTTQSETGSLRVLVVDDSPTMRQLLAVALRRVPNIALVEADNGAAGLELLAQQTFDLILVDLNMPVMNGFVFLENLRKIESAPPVIVITTESGQDDIDRAFALGAAAYVMKPVRAPDLADAITRVLGWA